MSAAIQQEERPSPTRRRRTVPLGLLRDWQWGQFIDDGVEQVTQLVAPVSAKRFADALLDVGDCRFRRL
jgi:hypothetical protein